jgi:hypothetical protein
MPPLYQNNHIYKREYSIKNVPPQKIPKFNAKLLISLTSTAQIRRELSNSGGPVDTETRRMLNADLGFGAVVPGGGPLACPLNPPSV